MNELIYHGFRVGCLFIKADYPGTPGHHAVLANLAVSGRRFAEALGHFQEAARQAPGAASYALGLGSVCLRLRRWEEAASHFSRAIGIDAHDPDAYESLAHAQLRRQRWADAAAAALESVGFEHHRPWAHLYLGIALLKLGQRERAMQAFETALSFHPPLRLAHFWMARALWGIPGRQQEALDHRARARLAREVRLDRQAGLEQIRAQSAVGAAERVAARSARKQTIAAGKKAEEEKQHAAEEKRQEFERLKGERGPVEFVIVSGLPRSGTSLMMQMLEAGGMTAMTDGERAADSDNPRGYLEWEAVKKLPGDPSLIFQAEGKVLKVVSMLLPHLPEGLRYKVLFMDRPVEEVAASHEKMILHRGEKAPALDPARMRQNLERHRQGVLGQMKASRSFDVLVVDYPSLVREPGPWIDRIAAFVGPQRLSSPQAMATAVDPALHRNRK